MTRLLSPRMVGALSLGVLAGCSTPVATSSLGDKTEAPAPPPQRGAAGPIPVTSASAETPKPMFREEDFAETDRSRDPFRSYARAFADQSKGRVKSQRHVLLDRYALEELKLIGLVTRTDVPRAMLVDPTGRGWVVVKGQFIGRAEVVHAGGPGGVDYELNWRVERIRDNDIVLVREDPAHGDVPAVTRVIALKADKIDNGDGTQVQ
jgi:type IV pilus assembly protein PilP